MSDPCEHIIAERDVLRLRVAEVEANIRELEAKLYAIREVVDEQAEDEALWTLDLDGTLSIAEAYLQQELRRLHSVIERQGS